MAQHDRYPNTAKHTGHKNTYRTRLTCAICAAENAKPLIGAVPMPAPEPTDMTTQTTHTVTLAKRGEWKLLCWQCDKYLPGSWHYKADAIEAQKAHKAEMRTQSLLEALSALPHVERVTAAGGWIIVTYPRERGGKHVLSLKDAGRYLAARTNAPMP